MVGVFVRSFAIFEANAKGILYRSWVRKVFIPRTGPVVTGGEPLPARPRLDQLAEERPKDALGQA
jgi:hypothetical protein